MPGIYSKDKFDLAGFCVGIVSKKKSLVKESKITMLFSSSINRFSFKWLFFSKIDNKKKGKLIKN